MAPTENSWDFVRPMAKGEMQLAEPDCKTATDCTTCTDWEAAALGTRHEKLITGNNDNLD